MLHVENTKNLSNNNFGVLGHTKAHYGCYEITKNGSLHIHTWTLWLDDFLNPNTLIQILHDDKIFQQIFINLNDIIT
jgi:hypothetical protein